MRYNQYLGTFGLEISDGTVLGHPHVTQWPAQHVELLVDDLYKQSRLLRVERDAEAGVGMPLTRRRNQRRSIERMQRVIGDVMFDEFWRSIVVSDDELHERL